MTTHLDTENLESDAADLEAAIASFPDPDSSSADEPLDELVGASATPAKKKNMLLVYAGIGALAVGIVAATQPQVLGLLGFGAAPVKVTIPAAKTLDQLALEQAAATPPAAAPAALPPSLPDAAPAAVQPPSLPAPSAAPDPHVTPDYLVAEPTKPTPAVETKATPVAEPVVPVEKPKKKAKKGKALQKTPATPEFDNRPGFEPLFLNL